MPYEIVLNEPSGMDVKTVVVYMENNGEYRQIRRTNVSASLDADSYIASNFSSLWDLGDPLTEEAWNEAVERAFKSLYKSVAQAAIQGAKGQSATLLDVVNAMNAEIDASNGS